VAQIETNEWKHYSSEQCCIEKKCCEIVRANTSRPRKTRFGRWNFDSVFSRTRATTTSGLAAAILCFWCRLLSRHRRILLSMVRECFQVFLSCCCMWKCLPEKSKTQGGNFIPSCTNHECQKRVPYEDLLISFFERIAIALKCKLNNFNCLQEEDSIVSCKLVNAVTTV
jgi:hypothetical protein